MASRKGQGAMKQAKLEFGGAASRQPSSASSATGSAFARRLQSAGAAPPPPAPLAAPLPVLDDDGPGGRGASLGSTPAGGSASPDGSRGLLPSAFAPHKTLGRQLTLGGDITLAPPADDGGHRYDGEEEERKRAGDDEEEEGDDDAGDGVLAFMSQTHLPRREASAPPPLLSRQDSARIGLAAAAAVSFASQHQLGPTNFAGLLGGGTGGSASSQLRHSDSLGASGGGGGGGGGGVPFAKAPPPGPVRARRPPSAGPAAGGGGGGPSAAAVGGGGGSIRPFLQVIPAVNVNPFLPPRASKFGRVNTRPPKVDGNAPVSRYLKNFEELSKLGSGGFCDVYRARSRMDGCTYAIKRRRDAVHLRGGGWTTEGAPTAARSHELKEVHALAALGGGCPHILRYQSAWREDEHLYIQTELAWGSLEDAVAGKRPGPRGTQRVVPLPGMVPLAVASAADASGLGADGIALPPPPPTMSRGPPPLDVKGARARQRSRWREVDEPASSLDSSSRPALAVGGAGGLRYDDCASSSVAGVGIVSVGGLVSSFGSDDGGDGRGGFAAPLPLAMRHMRSFSPAPAAAAAGSAAAAGGTSAPGGSCGLLSRLNSAASATTALVGGDDSEPAARSAGRAALMFDDTDACTPAVAGSAAAASSVVAPAAAPSAAPPAGVKRKLSAAPPAAPATAAAAAGASQQPVPRGQQTLLTMMKRKGGAAASAASGSGASGKAVPASMAFSGSGGSTTDDGGDGASRHSGSADGGDGAGTPAIGGAAAADASALRADEPPARRRRVGSVAEPLAAAAPAPVGGGRALSAAAPLDTTAAAGAGLFGAGAADTSQLSTAPRRLPRGQHDASAGLPSAGSDAGNASASGGFLMMRGRGAAGNGSSLNETGIGGGVVFGFSQLQSQFDDDNAQFLMGGGGADASSSSAALLGRHRRSGGGDDDDRSLLLGRAPSDGGSASSAAGGGGGDAAESDSAAPIIRRMPSLGGADDSEPAPARLISFDAHESASSSRAAATGMAAAAAAAAPASEAAAGAGGTVARTVTFAGLSDGDSSRGAGGGSAPVPATAPPPAPMAREDSCYSQTSQAAASTLMLSQQPVGQGAGATAPPLCPYRLSACDLLLVVQHVARGLAHMHAEGFAHLDVKPSNILVTYAAGPRMTDMDGEWRPEVQALTGLASTDGLVLLAATALAPPGAVPDDDRASAAELLASGGLAPEAILAGPGADAAASAAAARGLNLATMRRLLPVTYKLGDMGQVAPLGAVDVIEGDARYLSRELLNGDTTNLPATDVFALGLSLVELAAGKPLPTGDEPYAALREGVLPDADLAHLPAGLVELVAAMAHPDASMRPTAAQLLEHPLVRGLAWDPQACMLALHCPPELADEMLRPWGDVVAGAAAAAAAAGDGDGDVAMADRAGAAAATTATTPSHARDGGSESAADTMEAHTPPMTPGGGILTEGAGVAQTSPSAMAAGSSSSSSAARSSGVAASLPTVLAMLQLLDGAAAAGAATPAAASGVGAPRSGGSSSSNSSSSAVGSEGSAAVGAMTAAVAGLGLLSPGGIGAGVGLGPSELDESRTGDDAIVEQHAAAAGAGKGGKAGPRGSWGASASTLRASGGAGDAGSTTSSTSSSSSFLSGRLSLHGGGSVAFGSLGGAGVTLDAAAARALASELRALLAAAGAGPSSA